MLAMHPGEGPGLRLNLQTAYDLSKAENEMGARIENEVQPAA